MINEQIGKLDGKLDKLDEKIDGIDTRVTVIETEAKAHKGWILWLWGGLVTLVNIAFNYYTR